MKDSRVELEKLVSGVKNLALEAIATLLSLLL